VKELMIHRDDGVSSAEDAAHAATVYFVTADGMNGAANDGVPGTVNPARGPRIVNFNRTSNTKVDQHGLWLTVGGQVPVRRGNWGLARNNTGGDTGTPGKPATGGQIEVYSENIRAACGVAAGPTFKYGTWRRGDAQFSYDGRTRANEMIGDIIGHELGHRINCWHHASASISIGDAPGMTTDGWIDVSTTSPITTTGFSPSWPAGSWVSAAGERTCVMAYPYHEIWLSAALKYEWGSAWWIASDYDWAPTLPQRAPGYGAACDVPGRPSCRRGIIIDDAD
jgi:hypothetical protein